MKTILSGNLDLAGRVQSALGKKNLTLHQVSEESARLYGRSSPWFIRHNLYHALRAGEFGPSLHQLCALSRISGYRLYDWLTVFGFDLGGIPDLQVQLQSRRTLLLDASLDNPDSLIPWFNDVQGGTTQAAGMVPLGQLLKLSRPRSLKSLATTDNRNFLYAKIGLQDALAFPELLPGSIVRIDPRVRAEFPQAAVGTTSRRIFLIEHSNGFWCSRLYFSAKDRFHPISHQLPYARVEMEIPGQARILGGVDIEIRRVNSSEEPEVPKELADRWKPTAFRVKQDLSGLLRSARKRAALSFRQASAISRQIANASNDNRYFVAPGSLSDYEARNDPPRHIHKVITLCLIYNVLFADFLVAVNVTPEELGRDSMPGSLLPDSRATRPGEVRDSDETQRQNSTLASMIARFGEIPFFLRRSLASFSATRKASLRDAFWMESESEALHPYLREGLLVFVNRHKKKPVRLRSMPLWRQPLYVLMTREGKYLCEGCTLENGVLVLNPFSDGPQRPQLFRNRRDAEVIGQVVTIVRRLA